MLTGSVPFAEDIRDQVRVIQGGKSANERRVVDALVGISADLYLIQHTGPPRAGWRDLSVLDEVLATVRSLSSALAERFALPSVHMTTVASDPRIRYPRGGSESATRLAWKPVDRLWTAPLVEPASAWPLWAQQTGNDRAWDRQLRYESPSETSRVVVESLATADELVGKNSFEETARHLVASGVSRVDFSWLCVLEAECSALRAERDAASYPCALGTESSVWLTTPEPISELAVTDTARYVHGEPGLFLYR